MSLEANQRFCPRLEVSAPKRSPGRSGSNKDAHRREGRRQLVQESPLPVALIVVEVVVSEQGVHRPDLRLIGKLTDSVPCPKRNTCHEPAHYVRLQKPGLKDRESQFADY